MKIINKNTGEVIYAIITNHSMTLDEALDLMAPDDWKEQVNSNAAFYMEGFYTEDGKDIYYDDLDMED